MAVIRPARDHMPVQVRSDVAEAGEIHLVREYGGAHDRFDGADDIEQVASVGRRQVGHFADMRMPNHSAEAGEGRARSAADADDAAAIIPPKNFPPGGLA